MKTKLKIRKRLDFFTMRKITLFVAVIYLLTGILNGWVNFTGEYQKMFVVLLIEAMIVNFITFFWFCSGSWNCIVNHKATYYARLIKAATGEMCVYASLFFTFVDVVLAIWAFDYNVARVAYILTVLLVKATQILYIPFYRRKQKNSGGKLR